MFSYLKKITTQTKKLGIKIKKTRNKKLSFFLITFISFFKYKNFINNSISVPKNVMKAFFLYLF